jgi:hypothetical protein
MVWFSYNIYASLTIKVSKIKSLLPCAPTPLIKFIIYVW